MDEEQQVNDALEQLAPRLQPTLMVKDDDAPVWVIELPEDRRVVLSYPREPRMLLCSATFPAPAAVAATSKEIHEQLLTATQAEAERGGVSLGLDEDGVVIYIGIPWELLSEETLHQAIKKVNSSASSWQSALPEVEAEEVESPDEDVSDALRV